MGTMVEGTYVPLPERDDVTQVTATRIYRALYWRDWNTALEVIEGGMSRPSAGTTTAIRAALLAMPQSMRADPRWRRLAPLLAGPRAATTPTERRVSIDPLLTLTGEAIRRAQAGDYPGALAAVDRARELADQPEPNGSRARQLELARAVLAWAEIVAAGARVDEAIVLYGRSHALARELGDGHIAIAAASGAAVMQAAMGRNRSRDEWIAAAVGLLDRDPLSTPIPTSLRITLVFRALDRLDVAEARHVEREAAAHDPYEFDLALQRAQIDCVDAARDPALALADLDAAARVAPPQERMAPLHDLALTFARARLLALSGRVHAARDLIVSVAGTPVARADGAFDLAGLRALFDLECGDLDGALQRGYLATSRPAQARAHTLGSLVEAAALVERRHPDAPSACARAVALADERDLAFGLAMLPRQRLEAVLAFASAGSPSAERARAAIAAGTLRLPPRVPPAPVTLSAHERTVLRHLANGLSMGRIGMTMRLSVNTVKTHVRHIYRKLGVSNRAELVSAAAEHGLI